MNDFVFYKQFKVKQSLDQAFFSLKKKSIQKKINKNSENNRLARHHLIVTGCTGTSPSYTVT